MKLERVLLISLFSIAASASAEPAPDALPPQAELVFEEGFDKPELDAAWKVKAGQCQVIDGVLFSGPGAMMCGAAGPATQRRDCHARNPCSHGDGFGVGDGRR